MAEIPMQIVDAFAERPFTGQPAAIIPNAAGLTDQEMLQIAEELGMEAGFVVPPTERQADVKIRFFTRRHEASFSGHVVVAAFISLADGGFFKPTPQGLQLHQETAAGLFPVTLTQTAEGRTKVSFELPNPRFGEPVPVSEVAAALELPPETVCIGDHRPLRVSCGFDQIVVPVSDRAAMRGSFRNLDTMRELTDRRGASGFALFCPDTLAAQNDFNCRFLFPADACCEEPVSGTSVAAIAAYVVHEGLVVRKDDVRLATEQGYAVGRPCRVEAVVHSVRDRITRVLVLGTGAVVMRGSFSLEKRSQTAAF
jgi:trans-2,3-dihydro-3-hydroxyanthranilate isomerase